MNSINIIKQGKEVFQQNSKYKWFLISVFVTGLSYGLYKGMMDNFLAEVICFVISFI